jgi:hypothetical protein
MWRNWGVKIPCGLGLLNKEIPLNRSVGPTNQNVSVPPDLGPTQISHESTLNRTVGPTNQNVWVPPDVGPTRISHESTWVPPKHSVGPA